MENQMGENLDVRMSNYITILSVPNKYATIIDPEMVKNMRTVLKIYLASTAKKMVDDYQTQMRTEPARENVMRNF